MAKRKVQPPKSKAKTAFGLLSDVVKAIVAEPLRYDQTVWDASGEKGRQQPDCGTIGCAALWAVTLKRKSLKRDAWGGASIQNTAESLLGLDCEQGHELFGDRCVRFRDGVYMPVEPQTRAHVRAGVKHIRAFQAANRAQLLRTKV